MLFAEYNALGDGFVSVKVMVRGGAKHRTGSVLVQGCYGGAYSPYQNYLNLYHVI